MSQTETTQSLSLTLSRWHSVAERLNTRAKELLDRSVQTLSATTVTSASAGQVATLVQDGQDALDNIARGRALLQQVGAIRAALGQANHTTGVNQALARQQVLNREMAVVRSLAAIDVSHQVDPNALEGVVAASTIAGSSRNYGYGHNGVAVALLNREQVKAFARELEQMQAQAHALSDQINDLNRKKIAVVLSADAVALAGLAGLE